MSDDEDDKICPLCCEELDISDQNFLPCKCGYQARSGVLGSGRLDSRDPIGFSAGVHVVLAPH